MKTFEVEFAYLEDNNIPVVADPENPISIKLKEKVLLTEGDYLRAEARFIGLDTFPLFGQQEKGLVYVFEVDLDSIEDYSYDTEVWERRNGG